ncbi:hypothetical protein EDB92DRAFT_1886250 [Lactarius akahatsu]|uniref:Uncharacterized protein n=1 Tax=Lactarius akahatsu TaxID=416441 RepID=A0AAD4QA43_9AGAM|nr:hypothetical protein EDB92DRAFT_1886250 [Lactarius akahatsu]
MHSRRGSPIPRSLQTVRALRTRVQDPRCGPTHGIHDFRDAPSALPRIRLKKDRTRSIKRPFRARQERRYAPTTLPVVTMWASSRGVSRRMGVGVNAVCSLNSISTPPFLTLRRRVTMRHPSTGARREHGTSSSTRPQPWVMYGMVGAWPLSTSKYNTDYLDPFAM